MNHARYRNQYRIWEEQRNNPAHTPPPDEIETNFDIGLKYEKNRFGEADINITRFYYYGTHGYYFNYEDKSALSGLLDWNLNSEYSSNKHIGNRYPFIGGYNTFVRSRKPGSNRSTVNIVMLVFDSNSSKNNFYEKWKKEFSVR